MNGQVSAMPAVETPAPPAKKYPYYIENPVTENRVERFLEAFAAVLEVQRLQAVARLVLHIECEVQPLCGGLSVVSGHRRSPRHPLLPHEPAA